MGNLQERPFHLRVDAIAGSGKTTTILRGVHQHLQHNPGHKVLILTFSRKFAEEMQSRLNDYMISDEKCTCLTFHMAASRYLLDTTKYQFSYSYQSKADPIRHRKKNDPNLSEKLFKLKELGILQGPKERSLRLKAISFSRFAQKVIISKVSEESLEAVFQDWIDMSSGSHLLREDEQNAIIGATKKLLEYCCEDKEGPKMRVDYDDSVWIPVYTDCSAKINPSFQMIVVDEAQDVCPVFVEVLERIIHSCAINSQKTRVVFVGDSKQSIYRFIGSTNGMNNLETKIKKISIGSGLNQAKLAVKKFPLSVSFRCPSSHIALVKSLVPNMSPKENPNEGNWEFIGSEQFSEMAKVGDLVLSRLNFGLYKMCFDILIADEKPVRILGASNFLEDMILILVEAKKNPKPNEFISCLEKDEINFATKTNQTNKIWRINIFYRSLEEILCKSSRLQLTKNWVDLNPQQEGEIIDFVVEKLKGMKPHHQTKENENNKSGENYITFSTVHQAKGKEANRVFVLYPKEFLAQENASKVQIEQEQNIVYVALSRSKDRMYFVQKNPKDVFNPKLNLSQSLLPPPSSPASPSISLSQQEGGSPPSPVSPFSTPLSFSEAAAQEENCSPDLALGTDGSPPFFSQSPSLPIMKRSKPQSQPPFESPSPSPLLAKKKRKRKNSLDKLPKPKGRRTTENPKKRDEREKKREKEENKEDKTEISQKEEKREPLLRISENDNMKKTPKIQLIDLTVENDPFIKTEKDEKMTEETETQKKTKKETSLNEMEKEISELSERIEKAKRPEIIEAFEARLQRLILRYKESSKKEV